MDSIFVTKTRFAPSPTGFVHIGSLRTALFSFLFARKNKGVHILRIEDTDQNRLVPGAVENLLGVMAHMGIVFDEGYYLQPNGEVGERGLRGPYTQSKRLNIYHKHVEELVASKAAYYCFCSEQRLEDLRKEQIALKKPPMYDRLCRNLSDAEVQKKIQEFSKLGKQPVVRQAIPTTGETVIQDLIYGDIVVQNAVLDDQVLLKSDGFPTYHLAVVVDDHAMEITHVIRGEEWIASTPKHILLYQAFGWKPTAFAHLPLILNHDKTKLSKRQGDVAVEDFLAQGYLPEALLNFVAFLGWNPKTEQEIFSLHELIQEFDLSKVHKASAIFDIAKLDWLNSLYIRKLSLEELVNYLIPFWKTAGVVLQSLDHKYLSAIAALEQQRLKKLSEIVERTKYFFEDPVLDPSMLVWKKSTPEDTKQKLSEVSGYLKTLPESSFTKIDLEAALKSFILEKGYDNGSVLWPMRVALTGESASPGPFEVASVLTLGKGKDEVVSRLEKALRVL